MSFLGGSPHTFARYVRGRMK